MSDFFILIIVTLIACVSMCTALTIRNVVEVPFKKTYLKKYWVIFIFLMPLIGALIYWHERRKFIRPPDDPLDHFNF